MTGSTIFKERVEEAKARAGWIVADSRRYAEEELREMREGPLRSYLYTEDLLMARDTCVESVQKVSEAFLETCDSLIAIQDIMDSEVDHAFGIAGGIGEALDLVSHASTANDVRRRVVSIANRYADQIENLHREFETAWADLERECDQQLAQLKNAVAQTHGISVDVLDGAAKIAWTTGRVGAVVGSLTAAGAATMLFTSTVLVIAPLIWAMGAAREAASSVWDFFRRA
ncbi:hypothetical protein [Streptomyces sp. NPDC051014]|uniref:hypothetical protein n=1 Tax=Streptomyces sp. NPDC051014 TaxID=3155751 RepID=UPI0033E672E5